MKSISFSIVENDEEQQQQDFLEGNDSSHEETFDTVEENNSRE